jgi:hypothetical protein
MIEAIVVNLIAIVLVVGATVGWPSDHAEVFHANCRQRNAQWVAGAYALWAQQTADEMLGQAS